MGRILVMSIKPEFADRIFGGTKDVELRRVRPSVTPGDVVLVYASSPISALVGAFVVDGLVFAGVRELWKRHSARFGIHEPAYYSYFAGARTAYGLEIGARVRFSALGLEDLRRSARFSPPQSYSFWNRPLEDLLHDERLRIVQRLVTREADSHEMPLFRRASRTATS